MNILKKTSFEERLKAQQEAKQALLAKMARKPTVTAPQPVDRAAQRAAELERVRTERAAEREAARQAREIREAEERRLRQEAEEAAAAARRAERKEWKANLKQEKMDAKARRAARFAEYANLRASGHDYGHDF